MSVAEAPREVMTPEQAAEYLQVGREAIDRYIEDGRILAARVDEQYRIPRHQLDLLLWATRERSDIDLREYTEAEVARFLREDEPDDEVAAIMAKVTRSQTSERSG